ncbi:hypothetical protein WOLCODRAFT_131092 [Wolfiporia cocos MD-104 SS10]|uniref:Protein artemis n=1 Tax=Wolfiporia cocos (strain MD-104) TaxID=742152 RepID=A0A2H3JQ24_WOLCO|nr:hypothetical protein WOLCODRAFT_131092 [Wolfiporia cocos MD-104 SS10]
MPQGTPYDSFLRPYNIRVDNFTACSDTLSSQPLYLLTHTHTDHLVGLSAPSFSGTIICSADAKEMLLRHEVYTERALKDKEYRAEKVRTYNHLKRVPQRMQDGSVVYAGSRDLLRTLPLNDPTFEGAPGEEVFRISLLEANHCPGAVMFLVEGSKGAVLHTGDLRAEPWFLESLKRNPCVQRYLAPSNYTFDEWRGPYSVIQTLEAIYLDTACLLSTLPIPTKEEATAGLMDLMTLMPPTTSFFVNCWTWGYEDILKAIARTFRSKIHVDRYKYSVYKHTRGDLFLQSIITQDAASTRFHACERFNRCKHVNVEGHASLAPSAAATASLSVSGKHVVYVNPVNMGVTSWELYTKEMREKIARGELVSHLLVPLSRHSPLPELRAFVSLFKPKRVVPNTLDPALKGLDWACIEQMFEGCLAPQDTSATIPPEESTDIDPDELARDLLASENTHENVALKNLEGEGAEEIAKRWAESDKIRRKLEVMRQFLKGPKLTLVERILRGSPVAQDAFAAKEPASPAVSQVARPTCGMKKAPRGGRASREETAAAMARLRTASRVFSRRDSDDETEDGDAEEERARTAHYLFAAQAGISVDEYSPPFSPSSIQSQSAANSSPCRDIRLQTDLPMTRASSCAVQEASNRASSHQGRDGRTSQPKYSDPAQELITAENWRAPDPEAIVLPSFGDKTCRSPKRKREQLPTSDATSIQRQISSGSSCAANSLNLPAHASSSKYSTLVGNNLPLVDMGNFAVPSDLIDGGEPEPPAKHRKSNSRAEEIHLLTSGATHMIPSPAQFSHQAQVQSEDGSISEQTRVCENESARNIRLRQAIASSRESSVTSTSTKLKKIGIAERITLVCPELVAPRIAAKMERRRLPSQDDETDSSSIKVNSERVRQMAEAFKQEIAGGRRPGVVIPRLICLESQEET